MERRREGDKERKRAGGREKGEEGGGQEGGAERVLVRRLGPDEARRYSGAAAGGVSIKWKVYVACVRGRGRGGAGRGGMVGSGVGRVGKQLGSQASQRGIPRPPPLYSASLPRVLHLLQILRILQYSQGPQRTSTPRYRTPGHRRRHKEVRDGCNRTPGHGRRHKEVRDGWKDP